MDRKHVMQATEKYRVENELEMKKKEDKKSNLQKINNERID